MEQHRDGVARAHTNIRLQPLRSTTDVQPTDTKSLAFQKLMHNQFSPYTEKLIRRHHHTHIPNNTSFQLFNRRSVGPSYKENLRPFDGASIRASIYPETSTSYHQSRSKSVVNLDHEKFIKTPAFIELERKAKKEAEQALKKKKIFTITGPYHSLRQALRRRGWVEKFNNAPHPHNISNSCYKKKLYTDTDDDDDDITMPKGKRIPPWLEEDGIYGIMSHVIRNCTPTLMFTVKSTDVDSRLIKGGQLVNHFGKARTFTTKLGLCQNLRSVTWFDNIDLDSFYPRCYKMDEQEERDAFIDDYRTSAAFGFIKLYVERYDPIMERAKQEKEENKALKCHSENNSNTEAQTSRSTADACSRTQSQMSNHPSHDSLHSSHAIVTARSQSHTSIRSRNSNTEEVRSSKSNENGSETCTNWVTSEGNSDGVSLKSQSNVSTSDNTNTSVSRQQLNPTASPGESADIKSLTSPMTTPHVQASRVSDATTITLSSPPGTPVYLKKGGSLTTRALDVAVQECERYLQCKQHEDIDKPKKKKVPTATLR